MSDYAMPERAVAPGRAGLVQHDGPTAAAKLLEEDPREGNAAASRNYQACRPLPPDPVLLQNAATSLTCEFTESLAQLGGRC
jgi:hypothetical protein